MVLHASQDKTDKYCLAYLSISCIQNLQLALRIVFDVGNSPT